MLRSTSKFSKVQTAKLKKLRKEKETEREKEKETGRDRGDRERERDSERQRERGRDRGRAFKLARPLQSHPLPEQWVWRQFKIKLGGGRIQGGQHCIEGGDFEEIF